MQPLRNDKMIQSLSINIPFNQRLKLIQYNNDNEIIEKVGKI